MKKEKVILVAIDFSKCSIRGLEFAINIANSVKANILMVYVDKSVNSESIYSKRGKEHLDKLTTYFNKLIVKYKPKLKGKLDYKIRKGKVYSEITGQAKYSDAYMIIAGTHGVSGFEEFWIGSNAYKMVGSATCPVITIRESFSLKSKHINKILLPIDSTMESRQKVPFVTELAKMTRAKIYVLGVYSTKMKEIKHTVTGYTKQAVEHIEKNGLKCHCEYKFCENIADGIIEYAEDINADLIAIMTEQEKSTKNLWLGNYAQQMVNHSKIPVLSYHSKNI